MGTGLSQARNGSYWAWARHGLITGFLCLTAAEACRWLVGCHVVKEGASQIRNVYYLSAVASTSVVRSARGAYSPLM
jgi:hypothetical protein